MEAGSVHMAGQRGGVRLPAHLGWEALLAVAAVSSAAVAWAQVPGLRGGQVLDGLVVHLAVSVLLASAVAVTLRVGSVNLGAGAIAACAGAAVAWLGTARPGPLMSALVLVLLVATAAGLITGSATVWLRAPGWMVGLAAGWGGLVIAGPAVASAPVKAPTLDIDSVAWWLLGTAAAVSVLGGAGAMAAASRRARAVTDDVGADSGFGRGMVVIASWGASALLAACAGILDLLRPRLSTASGATEAVRAAVTSGVADGTMQSVLGASLTAVAAVVLGGTSVHGRHGGIAGTALAAVLIELLVLVLISVGGNRIAVGLMPVFALSVGLVAGRALHPATDAVGPGARPEAARLLGAESAHAETADTDHFGAVDGGDSPAADHGHTGERPLRPSMHPGVDRRYARPAAAVGRRAEP